MTFSPSKSGIHYPLPEVWLPLIHHLVQAETLIFARPSLESLVIHLQRQLRFKPPVTRFRSTIEQFWQRHLQLPKLSNATVSQLPTALLAHGLQWLWLSVLTQTATTQTADAEAPVAIKTAAEKKARGTIPLQVSPLDFALNMALLAEDLQQFDALPWVQGDIHFLKQSNGGDLHSGAYGDLNTYYSSDQLDSILVGHGFSPLSQFPWATHTTSTSDVDLTAVATGYLMAKQLTYPLPLAAFLQAVQTQTENPAWLNEAWFLRLRHYAKVFQVVEKQSPSTEVALRQWWQDLTTTPLSIPNEVTSLGWVRPVRRLILVEGRTEEAILPAFGQLLGLPFEAQGWLLQTAGGKNQILAQYDAFAQQLNVPITVVLDQDALPVYQRLAQRQRVIDQSVIWAEGELEDALDWPLILAVINRFFQPVKALTIPDVERFQTEWLHPEMTCRRVDVLQRMWPYFELNQSGSTSFSKAEFAAAVRQFCEENPKAAKPLIPEAIVALIQGMVTIWP